MHNSRLLTIYGLPDGVEGRKELTCQEFMRLIESNASNFAKRHIALSVAESDSAAYAIVGFHESGGLLSVGFDTSSQPFTSLGDSESTHVIELWVQGELTEFSAKHFAPLPKVLMAVRAWLNGHQLDQSLRWEQG